MLLGFTKSCSLLEMKCVDSSFAGTLKVFLLNYRLCRAATGDYFSFNIIIIILTNFLKTESLNTLFDNIFKRNIFQNLFLKNTDDNRILNSRL